MNKRFIISFRGDCDLNEEEFFAGEEPEALNPDTVRESLDGIGAPELLYDWQLGSELMVSVHDTYTGARYVLSGESNKWIMVDEDMLVEAGIGEEYVDPGVSIEENVHSLERRMHTLETIVDDLEGKVYLARDVIESAAKTAVAVLKEYED